MFKFFKDKFDLVGTLKGKVSSMNKAQKEFYDCLTELNSAEENFKMANDNFVDTSIRQVDAAETHLRAILNEVRNSDSRKLEGAFENSNVARIGFDGHIIYNR